MFEYGENVNEQNDAAIESMKKNMSSAAFALAEQMAEEEGAEILREKCRCDD